MLYIAADHAGFELKNKIRDSLKEKGIQIEDLGPPTLHPEDDYPDFASLVAHSLRPDDQGILICGSGQGVCIAANKIKGIRAAQAWSVESAQTARRDDDANILCLASRLSNQDDPLAIVEAFLNQNFDSAPRRIRRLEKIAQLEN